MRFKHHVRLTQDARHSLCMQAAACVWLLALAGELPSPGEAAEPAEREPGFTPLFNGKDLSGWKIRDGESLEGKAATAKQRIQVVDGKLVIDGKAKGNLVIDTLQSFSGDVHLKFQYLPSDGCNNDIYFRGVKFDLKRGGVKNIEFGKPNELEILVRGTAVEIKNNGQTQRTSKAKSDSSSLGIRAEFGAVEIWNIRFK